MAASPDPANDRRPYEVLRERILRATYRPGHVIREAALAESLGVSRTPAREALLRLEQDGLVERATRGMRVRSRTVEEIGAVYEACIVIEPAVAALAALRRRPEHLLALEDVLAAATTAIEVEGSDMRPLMDEWHDIVWRAAANPPLSEALSRLSAQLFGVPAPAEGPSAWRASLTSHREITESIRQQDPDGAASGMRAHMQLAQSAALRAMQDRTHGPDHAPVSTASSGRAVHSSSDPS